MEHALLENEKLRLVVQPSRGVGVLAFFARSRDQWLPIMPDARDPKTGMDCSSFVMLPYSNRIEDGRFNFGGQDYQLDHGEKHAIHGDTRQRPWAVETLDDERVCCTLDSADHEAVNWPWPFEARIEYLLDDNRMLSRFRLTNRGTSAMPAGGGWHPYFSRALTCTGEPVHLQFKTRGLYPDENGTRIPSGPADPVPQEQDFSEEKPLPPEMPLDHCFQGYDGNGSIRWPESSVTLTFSCSPVCTHLVLFNPPEGHFAVEPVLNANNGVNLLAEGRPESGVVVLNPGEYVEAEFALRVQCG